MNESALTDAFRAATRRKLPPRLFNYLEEGGAAGSVAVRNVADMQSLSLRVRTLSGVSDRISLATEVLGQSLAMPVILGPVGITGMYARHGEVAGAIAAKAAGVTMCQPMLSVRGADEVSAAAGPVWSQISMLRDRGLMKTLMEQSWALGSPVLALTVDVAIPEELSPSSAPFVAGWMRNMYDGLTRLAWMNDVYLRGRPHTFGTLNAAVGSPRDLMRYWYWLRPQLAPTVTPDDLAWVRAEWPGKLVVKGVLDTADAHVALEAGADGLVVSNHGGRRSPVTPSVTSVLPQIAEVVDGRAAVLMDGGVRSGHDVVRALALGAQACLLGRAWIYALAAEGQAGVERLLKSFREDIAETTMQLGLDDVRQIGPDALTDGRRLVNR